MPQPLRLSISKQQIATLPQSTFGGEIHVIDSIELVTAAVEHLEKHAIIGFDTETKPSFKKGAPNKVALMQLSTDDTCYLFRLNKIGFPDELIRLIENPDIIKIGLSIRDDFHVMHRSSDVKPAGFIELQEYVKDFSIIDISLQKIYAILFDKKISKNQRLTNWEADKLTNGQKLYAATDAWACLRIYKHLSCGLFNPQKCKYIAPEEEPVQETTTNPTPNNDNIISH